MNAEQKQELRELVRQHLAERPRIGLRASDVQMRIRRQIECTTPEVEDALALLVSLGQAQAFNAQLGATKYYQITAAGILAYERGE